MSKSSSGYFCKFCPVAYKLKMNALNHILVAHADETIEEGVLANDDEVLKR